ncbi:hypothetical protein CBR_g38170 [Chara braunii]|uniref:Uncharacterized protein n=1 Tax=Chara braunii TaxID=69332 RepID=A0A388LPL3_CHABU|nr:hypothetical protein CBR_g38170 [Chara braunii]|eukprot:GBG84199.1 hypothetical protein CBR_g38170 [Chara braunii]
MYSKFVEDTEKEARRKEEEEKEKAKKEEEEKRCLWVKEREEFEEAMGTHLEKRLDALGVMRGKSVDDGTTGCSSDEVSRLRRENEDLKKKLSEALCHSGDDRVLYLQKEVMELRRQVAGKQVNEDAILALKEEIGELINFEQEIAGLRKEVNLLRDQNARVIAEAGQWKEEALRPGNKRGCVAMQTPDCSNRGTRKPRRSEVLEALKEKRAEAEMKRMEAEKHVMTLEEQMSRLMAGGDNDNAPGGTNLKERLEEVAVRSARKGMKATPRRAGGPAAPAAENGLESSAKKSTHTVANDRAEFVEEQKKQLRMLRKIGLEPLCKEEGVKLGKFEDTICELAEARARKAFGDGKGIPPKQAYEIQEVSEDTSREVSNN